MNKKQKNFTFKNRKSVLSGVLVCTAICAVGLIAYIGYVNNINDYAINSVYVSLGETATQQKFNINQELNTDTMIFADMAAHIGESINQKAENSALLLDLTKKTHFASLTFFDAQNHASIVAGAPIDPPDTVFSFHAKKSDIVKYTVSSSADKDFFVSLPVFDKNQNRLGTFVGIHTVDELRSVLLPFFHRNGVTYIVDKSGTLITSCGSPNSIEAFGNHQIINFWDEIEDTEYIAYDTVDEMNYNIADSISGNMIYIIEGQKRYAHYEPIGNNDWFVFTVVGDQAVAQHRDTVLKSAFILTFIMLGTFFILIIYILWQQRKHRNKLERAAYYDELCKCPNLSKFKITSQQFIEQHRGEKLLMIKLDIDRFKLINQTFGVKTGDLILKKVAEALSANAQNDECRFARAHDDEFYILQRYQKRPELSGLKHSFYDDFSSRMGKDFNYHIQFISGVCFITPGSSITAVDAIERANIAHQKAKATSQEICIYDETLIKEALRKKDIEDRMEYALKNHEFQVYFQPQFSLLQNKIFGAEALVRWCISDTEKVYPNEFIPIFEENNFIIQLDMYMFERVCEIIRAWINEGITPITVSVNFARNHLADSNFVESLCAIADKYSIPHNLLEIELTERAIAQNEELSLKILDDLHHYGFGLSMDDFGTGYSSLGLLKNTPVDVIKIDKSFFDNADDQPRTKAVLHNVLQLAKDLHAYTIAEGVETELVATLLRELGCDAIQGYYYGYPVPESEFKQTLSRKNEIDKNSDMK